MPAPADDKPVKSLAALDAEDIKLLQTYVSARAPGPRNGRARTRRP